MDDDHEFEFEDFVKDLARDLVERGNNLLSDPRETDEGREQFEKALRKLESGSRGITDTFDLVRKVIGPAAAEYGYASLWDFVTGACTVSGEWPTPNYKNYMVRELGSDGGKKGGSNRRTRAEVWHVEARSLLPDAEKNNPGLSPRKLAPFVISRCKTVVGIEAMTKLILSERKSHQDRSG